MISILGMKVGGDPSDPLFYYNFSPRKNCKKVTVQKIKGFRMCHFHTDQGVYVQVNTLDAAKHAFSPESFVLIHPSNLVNMEKVRRIKKEYGLYVAYFDDGDTASVSSDIADSEKYHHLIIKD